jgi:hypothetical protein
LRITSPHIFEKLLREGRGKEVKPISSREIMERFPCNIFVGPMKISGGSPIAPISASQIELENKLNIELNKLTDGMYL